jgi:hypothetical protein
VAGGDLLGGGVGKLCKTTNSGSTWVEVDYTLPLGGTEFPTGADGMFWLDANTGYLGGTNGKIVKTTDGGSSWSLLPVADPDSGDVTDIWFTTTSNGYYSNNQGEVYITTNAGSSWSLSGALTPGGFYSIYCLEFSDVNHGFAGSIIGLYLYTTTGGGSVQMDVPADEIGLEIAPNPTSGLISILAQLPEMEHAQIMLSDLAGRELMQWNVSGMQLNKGAEFALGVPPGIYMLQVSANNKRSVAKVIVSD